jgi:hypothetical protein
VNFGVPLVESWHVGRGVVLQVVGRGPVMHPSDLLRLRNRGRTPFWSANTLGERELQRDRRRRAR